MPPPRNCGFEICGRAPLQSATEITRLTKKLGKKSGSIWNMDKSELVEVARMELGVTLAQAEKMTVTVLREKRSGSSVRF